MKHKHFTRELKKIASMPKDATETVLVALKDPQTSKPRRELVNMSRRFKRVGLLASRLANTKHEGEAAGINILKMSIQPYLEKKSSVLEGLSVIPKDLPQQEG